uniref:Uncharacterized protein n=1 Tax=Strongyloides papillosus TaxID=174720 RepID=A0A0N5C821_STREA
MNFLDYFPLHHTREKNFTLSRCKKCVSVFFNTIFDIKKSSQRTTLILVYKTICFSFNDI